MRNLEVERLAWADARRDGHVEVVTITQHGNLTARPCIRRAHYGEDVIHAGWPLRRSPSFRQGARLVVEADLKMQLTV